MSDLSMPAVSALYRYPVKGLSGQPLGIVALRAGEPMPFDRVWALARPGSSVNPANPSWAKKGHFVTLMLDEGLARVRSALDPQTLRLTIHEADRARLSVNLADAEGRAAAEAFLHGLTPHLAATPRLVRAQSGHFMDKPDPLISLINLATLRSLEQQWGVKLDKLRFRANIYIDGVEPWAEFDWIGQDISIGAAEFTVDRRNGRCAAINVNPATGLRDLDIPGRLRSQFGHKDLGVYLVARNDALLSVGDAVDPPDVEPLLRAVATPDAEAAARYICNGCYYIYAERQDSPGFAGLPNDWQCPDCGTGKTSFRPVAG